MSIQLIVYPQNYDGSPNAISGNTTEFIVDGINFNTVSTSSQYSPLFAPIEQNAINYYIPTLAVNQWDRYMQSLEIAPTGSGGQLFFLGTVGGAKGIIQKLSNLTSGATYNVTFDIASVSGSSSVLTVSTYTGTVLNSSVVVPQSVGSVSVQFTANSTTDTIAIGYVGTDTIVFNSISVVQASASPSGNIFGLGDGQVICDLYEDEDIPLSLSVDDFKNVAEKVQSYSKAFNLPATKRNNRIFDNIFEVTRSDDGIIFNPYKKTQCVLKQDGFILFDGYLRMLDVSDKEGEISYNVNLYSEVIALADVLKDREFRDLDFSELEHDYNFNNIRNSWQGILQTTNPLPTGTFAGTVGASTTGVLKYPFVDWNHKHTIGASGNPILPNLESSFRPFISIKYLIDRIFNQPLFPFTYESEFFDTDDFKKLYMDFNWGSDNSPVVFANSGEMYRLSALGIPSTYLTLTYDPFIVPSDFGFSGGVFTAVADGQTYNINYNMLFDFDLLGGELRVRWVVNGIPQNQFTVIGSSTTINYTGSFSTTLQSGDTIFCEAIALQGNPLTGIKFHNVASVAVTATTSVNQTTDETLLDTLRGELGQWDFLKGLMTMFNLVSLPDKDNPNNIKFEPYADIFITPALTTPPLDWTDKIDVSAMKLKPLTDLNKKTIFKFVEDDDDFAFTNYKNQVGGHLYGSKKYDAGDEFNILDGEDEIVAEPFAATVIKPLMSQYPSLIVPAIYSMNEDGTSEGFDNSPRIMYSNGVKTLTSTTYNVPAQNGGAQVAFEDEFLQFSHLSDVSTITGTRDFHFGECQLLVGASVPDNLFNLYWLPYYSELYNPNTRIMTIKVNLTPADINTFKFNDTVFIKNRTFRVNKIDYKPNDLATVEFILIP